MVSNFHQKSQIIQFIFLGYFRNREALYGVKWNSALKRIRTMATQFSNEMFKCSLYVQIGRAYETLKYGLLQVFTSKGGHFTVHKSFRH